MTFDQNKLVYLYWYLLFWAKYYIYARKFMKTRRLGQFWNTFLYISRSKCRVYNTKISWVPILKKRKEKDIPLKLQNLLYYYEYQVKIIVKLYGTKDGVGWKIKC